MAKPEPPYMNNKEAIAAAQEGKRAVTKHSLFAADWAVPSPCKPGGHGFWRTVACDSETDVIECSKCGEQRTAACDFDEEYA